MLFDSILVTTDFSRASSVAFDLALYQAKAVHGNITLLTVLCSEDFSTQILPEEEFMRQKREELQDLASCSFHKYPPECVILRSRTTAQDAVLQYLEEEPINLIVLASHGHTANKELPMGGTAQSILHCAPYPVLLIPSFTETGYRIQKRP